MANIVTITVDLDKVRALVKEIARDNSGLETSSGLLPSDLDCAISEVLVKGDATYELRHLMMKIVEIHEEEHALYEV